MGRIVMRGVHWGLQMLFALGAASSAIDILSSIKPAGQSGHKKPSNTFSVTGDTASANSAQAATPQSGLLSPDTYAALLASQSQAGQTQTTGQTPATQSPSSALKDLFSLLDTNGDGQISKSEFESQSRGGRHQRSGG